MRAHLAGTVLVGWCACAFAGVAGCFPKYGIAAGGADASLDAGIDVGAEAGPPLPAITRVLLGSTAFATQTGNAQQQHLIFAGARYWFFYFDSQSSNVMKTRWSTDFATWTEGASLTLPMGHGGEGRNLSVAYRVLAGTDVVHIATSLHEDPKRIVYDTRATISGGTITFGTPALVHDLDTLDTWVDASSQAAAGSQGGPACDPDGTDVAIGPDGRVFIATAWVAVPVCCYCDSNFTMSTMRDLGTSWTQGFVSPLQHYTVGGTTNARQIVALASGSVLGGWDDGMTPVSDVTWAIGTSSSWTDESSGQSGFSVFQGFYSAIQEPDDWSICRIDDNRIHALRRRYADGGSNRVFEHYLFVGSAWSLQSTLADDPGIAGSGVVLLTNGTSLLAASIAKNGTVRYATWSGGTWSAWRTIGGADAGGAVRSFLGGTGCDETARPALIWTEGSAPPYQVMGVPVGTLMP